MQDLDLTGLKCPLPVLRTQKALSSMVAGDVVRVTTTDPMSAVDLPHFCNQHGHRLLESEELAQGTMRFLIEKKANADQQSVKR